MSFFRNIKKDSSDLTPVEFKKRFDSDPNAELLDVRTAGEYASGKIGEARNIDILESGFQEKVAALPKDKNYYVYCHSGVRSKRAVRLLKDLDHEAYNLEGGISKWPF